MWPRDLNLVEKLPTKMSFPNRSSRFYCGSPFLFCLLRVSLSFHEVEVSPHCFQQSSAQPSHVNFLVAVCFACDLQRVSPFVHALHGRLTQSIALFHCNASTCWI